MRSHGGRKMTTRFVSALAIISLMALCAACTQAPAPSLDDLMETYFAAEGTSTRNQAIRSLVYSGASAEAIAARLRVGRTYPADVARGWSVQTIESIDNVTRPFHVFVPESYDPAAAHPVIVNLHGLVSVAHTVEDLIPSRSIWEAAAMREGMIVILPHGDGEAVWWSHVGRTNVNAALSYVKRHLNVDENRVFIAGFSDGGSGAFWLALQDPTPWAGFISYLGTPGIGAVGSYHAYPRNLLNRPLRIVNGLYDPLYPAREMRLYVDQLEDRGVDVEWEAYPTGHDFSFFAEEEDRSLEFISTVVRDPLLSHVVWETAEPRVGRCDWVQIDEISTIGDSGNIEDVNLFDRTGQSLVGVEILSYTEDGGLVASVIPGFVADLAGVQVGDRLATVNDSVVESADDIRRAMEGSQPGDVIRIAVIRDSDELALSATVPEPFAIYPRVMMAGMIDVVADGNRIDVSAHNVIHYTLYISSKQFDLGQPLEVITNGRVSFHDTVNPNIRFMLEQAAADLDRQAIYEAKLEIIVAPSS